MLLDILIHYFLFPPVFLEVVDSVPFFVFEVNLPAGLGDFPPRFLTLGVSIWSTWSLKFGNKFSYCSSKGVYWKLFESIGEPESTDKLSCSISFWTKMYVSCEFRYLLALSYLCRSNSLTRPEMIKENNNNKPPPMWKPCEELEETKRWQWKAINWRTDNTILRYEFCSLFKTLLCLWNAEHQWKCRYFSWIYV